MGEAERNEALGIRAVGLRLAELQGSADREAAAAEVERIVAEHPDNLVVLRLAVSFFEASGDRERLLASLRAILRLGPRQGKYALRLAGELSADGLHDEALSVLAPGLPKLIDASRLTEAAVI